jgi:ribosomal RNA-processing protein 9
MNGYSSHEREILAVASSHDGRLVVAGGREKKILVFDRRMKDPLIHSFSGHNGDITGLSFQTGSNTLFSCSADRTLKHWDLNEMGYVETMFGHQVWKFNFSSSLFILYS